MTDEMIGREEFLTLPTAEIRGFVHKRPRPYSGIFVADGNRRLVMTQTGLTPKSKDFYPAYLEVTTESFMKNLVVFFDHGLHTLFFPLFGPSLLMRGDTYCQYVIPELIRILFQDKKWLDFYREYGIRIKAYGNVHILGGRLFKGRDLGKTIKKGQSHTRRHRKHKLFYGFFSTRIFERALVRKFNRFIEDHNRVPDREEMSVLYYGEPIATADFFITSTKMGGLDALPPLVYGKDTCIYTLAVPGVFGLTEKTYREILYDLLFLRQDGPGRGLDDTGQREIEDLKDFYRQNRDRVMGTGKRIGKYWVLDA